MIEIGKKYLLNFGGVEGRYPNKEVTVISATGGSHWTIGTIYRVEADGDQKFREYWALEHELKELKCPDSAQP